VLVLRGLVLVLVLVLELELELELVQLLFRVPVHRSLEPHRAQG
jgi:hypothetical protein